MNWFKSRENLSAFWAGLIAVIVLACSFYRTDAEVYLFPRIVAICIAILAGLLVYSVVKDNASNNKPTDQLINWSSLLPGLSLGVVYILFIETVGFYISSFLAFVAITMLYGKRGAFDSKALVYKIIVATIFMAVLYVLFWKLLHVRTPTGLLL